MRTNNRMPVYEVKVVTPPKQRYRSVKNGKSIWVDGEKPDPYKNVSCESLTLQSRISTGTFENHEGRPRLLEKANGSDVASAAIAASLAENARHNREVANNRARSAAIENAKKVAEEQRKKENNV